MTKKYSEAWKDSWEIIKTLGEGGQGRTFLAKRKDGSGEGYSALKVLTRQGDMERRARMYREVAALQTLVSPGIPRVTESNASRYEDETVGLFLAMEYIEGSILSDVSQLPLQLESALALFEKLLEIVEYCHGCGVRHRDIKPDNIVLRGGDLLQPVLLDFGLSFMDPDSTSVTPVDQQLGNRFLHLPELLVDTGGRRDERSDLTHCCGILYYLLTREQPVTLVDGDGHMPHERKEAIAAFKEISPRCRGELQRIFDVAFKHRVDERFQSVPAIRLRIGALRESLNAADRSPGTSDHIRRVRERFRASKEAHPRVIRERQFEMLESVAEYVHEGLIAVKRELDDNDVVLLDYNRHKLAKGVDHFQFQQGISHQYTQSQYLATINIFLTSKEVIVRAESEGQPVQDIVIVPLRNALDEEGISDAAYSFFWAGVVDCFDA